MCCLGDRSLFLEDGLVSLLRASRFVVQRTENREQRIEVLGGEHGERMVVRRRRVTVPMKKRLRQGRRRVFQR